MKNILVAVDFSEASFNALSYAAFITNTFNAKLTMLHAYTGTSSFDESPEAIVYDSKKELELANEKFLKKKGDFEALNFLPVLFLIRSTAARFQKNNNY